MVDAGGGTADQVRSAVQRYHADPAYLVQILHAVQDAQGFISSEALGLVAEALDAPRARISGVRDFYSFLHGHALGGYEILFSDNITDHFLGKEALLHRLCEKLWLEPGKLSEDGRVRVGSASCIGLSDQGPAALVNGVPVTRLTTERIDAIAGWVREGKPLAEWPPDYFSIDDNIQHGDWLLSGAWTTGRALDAAIRRGGEATLAMIDQSGLRGRGGAGFKTSMKWLFCRDAAGEARFVVCNADEGEPGTFKDRVLLRRHAEKVFEGMAVCARVIGARRGFLYLRAEYRYMLPQLEETLTALRRQGFLGERIAGTMDFHFDIEIHLGAGAYICGEESALIESLEGKRGVPRNRPPFPVSHGYLGQPTVVNNVETFAAAAKIVADGDGVFAALGTPQSSGTKLLSICGDCERPGVYEYPYGVAIRQILDDCGARDACAVQVGGPSGTVIGSAEFDRRVSFEDLPTGGSFMIFGQGRDLFEVARNFTTFFAHESCGFCTPCRVGTTLMKKGMDKIAAGNGTAVDLAELEKLGRLTHVASHCGLGQTAANPVLLTLEKFRGDYDRRLKTKEFEPAFDLDGALEAARKITGRDDAAAHLGAKK